MLNTIFAVIVVTSPFANVAAGSAPIEQNEPWLRVAPSATLGFGSIHREHGDVRSLGVATLGADILVFPHDLHGAHAAVLGGGSVFGPSVLAVDTGYALRWGSEGHHRGVTGDFMLVAGPSLAVVRYAQTTGMSASDFSPASEHVVLGVHAGASAHLYLWKVALGWTISYRVGGSLSGGDGLSGMFSMGPTLGFIVDP